jgi:tetratricopeptide (TPR) repeat protein
MRTFHQVATLALAAVPLLFSGAFGVAQPRFPQAEASPAAVVTQTIGITKVTVDYHRPGVKGRQVWGKLVPFGEVWRAGANENTTISFADPVMIEGKPLAAGTYGLHMIPTEGDWTVIVSRNATSWGSYFYDKAEDVFRVPVKPRPADPQEWLSYEFTDLTDSSAVLLLRWEKLAIPVRVTLDTRSLILARAKNEYLRGMAGFTWQGFNQAAAYCLANNINLDEAMRWADQSTALNTNFSNLRVKAGLLEKAGRKQEADALREQSMKLATEAEINTLGYQYMNAGKMKEALETFKKNVKDHPDSWNVYDSLAEAYEKSGEKKLAMENYSQALKRVQDATNKKRITETLQKLGAK